MHTHAFRCPGKKRSSTIEGYCATQHTSEGLCDHTISHPYMLRLRQLLSPSLPALALIVQTYCIVLYGPLQVITLSTDLKGTPAKKRLDPTGPLP